MAGRAVATIVWSTIARNIGSMIDGKRTKKTAWLDGASSPTDRLALDSIIV
jgi:hypothetical protein